MLLAQHSRDALLKQHAHPRSNAARLLQRCNGQIPRNGGEIIKEFFQRLATLDVVDQCLHWHARTHEYRRAAKDLRIRMND